MSQLRDLHSTAKRRRSIKIDYECLKNLDMFLGFLNNANNRISMNSIAFRRPTHIYRSDSCLTGLGGYSNRGWFEQLARTLGSNYLLVSRHPIRPSKKPRLCFVDDQ